MAITTSDSINVPKPPVCAKCGHSGGLLQLDANARKVHFDDCPEGPPPEPEPVLIAHDPLADGRGPNLLALQRLKDLGHGLTMERQRLGFGSLSAEKVRPSEVLELKTEEIAKRLAEEEASGIAFPPPVGSEEPQVGDGPRPLSAKNRRKPD